VSFSPDATSTLPKDDCCITRNTAFARFIGMNLKIRRPHRRVVAPPKKQLQTAASPTLAMR